MGGGTAGSATGQESKSLTLDDKRDWMERRRGERRDPRGKADEEAKNDEVEGEQSTKEAETNTCE